MSNPPPDASWATLELAAVPGSPAYVTVGTTSLDRANSEHKTVMFGIDVTDPGTAGSCQVKVQGSLDLTDWYDVLITNFDTGDLNQDAYVMELDISTFLTAGAKLRVRLDERWTYYRLRAKDDTGDQSWTTKFRRA